MSLTYVFPNKENPWEYRQENNLKRNRNLTVKCETTVLFFF